MNYGQVKSNLLNAVSSPNPGEELAKLATTFKELGASKEDVIGWLRRLREELPNDSDETKDDAIADAIEFVWRNL